MRNFFRNHNNQEGQTSVEYILLLLVVVTVGFSVFKKIDEYLVSNPDSLINIYLESFKEVFGAGHSGVNLKYKRFFIRR